MLRRTHVEPFLTVVGDRLVVELLEPPPDETVLFAFLDRLLRLLDRLRGRPRGTVVEALRRQERRVRDVRRLSGLAKALLDVSEFRPPPGAEKAPALRRAVFEARGRRWPPTAGDEDAPYREAAAALGLPDGPDEVKELLHSDRSDRARLVRVPRFDAAGLLARYNLELVRAALLEAESVTLRARGGWRGVFRSVKLARLMVRIEREGRRQYRLEITGPAAPWVTRGQRYGVRLARVLPALLRAPAARVEASVRRGDRLLRLEIDGADHREGLGRRRRRSGPFDSTLERDLARVLRDKIGTSRDGWTLVREDAPVPLRGGAVFLPDFTLRHRDGREAMVELVGFWTPRYLAEKRRKVTESGLDNLVLVVSRRLGVGAEALAQASEGTVVWFTERPTARPVLEAAAQVAR